MFVHHIKRSGTTRSCQFMVFFCFTRYTVTTHTERPVIDYVKRLSLRWVVYIAICLKKNHFKCWSIKIWTLFVYQVMNVWIVITLRTLLTNVDVEPRVEILKRVLRKFLNKKKITIYVWIKIKWMNIVSNISCTYNRFPVKIKMVLFVWRFQGTRWLNFFLYLVSFL